MPAKKYRLNINEATLPLITFLNDGVEPQLIEGKDPWFLFTLDSPREITVGKDAVQLEDDLYDATGRHLKDEYFDHQTLIG